jgi:hypothetical protein
MDDPEAQPRQSQFRRLKRWFRIRRTLILVILAAALTFDLSIAFYLNTQPLGGDAKVYSRIAVNIIDHGVFSPEEQPDQNGEFRPSIIRLPGYPLFLAGIYSAAGKENYPAVRAVQGVMHFLSAVMAAFIAFLWVGGKKRRRRKAAIWTFLLAAFCPFTANYSAMLLTEVPTIFLMTAMMLSGTLAIRAESLRRSLLWWSAAGLAGGLAVEMRPDSGLFAFALGLTMIVAAVSVRPFKNVIVPFVIKGAVFSLAFVIVLVPWTIRNEQVFGMFQPLAPEYAAAPDEFLPRGYFHWLRTWVNDFKYVSPTQWELEIRRIDIDKLPASAFDSDEERARIAALIDQYNNSDPDHPLVPKQSADDESANDDSDKADSDNDSDQDSADDNSEDNDDLNQELDLHISPEVDAEFEKIAEQRVARYPLRYYVFLPAERAATMWFDTHSDFYPFGGELLPLTDLDTDVHQDIWLPLFVFIDIIYTIIGVAGLVLLWTSGWPRSHIWVFMALALIITRVVLFSTLENPEPRYLIELFFIAAILGGIAISRTTFELGKGSLGLRINYGRDRKRSA